MRRKRAGNELRKTEITNKTLQISTKKVKQKTLYKKSVKDVGAKEVKMVLKILALPKVVLV
jgi:hypothetical protein